MLLQNRINFVEQIGFIITNTTIRDIQNGEELKIVEEGQYFGKKYQGNKKTIIFKNSGEVYVKINENQTLTLSGTTNEELITIKNKSKKTQILTTIEGMMYKVGSIIIKENNNILVFTQRIEKGEIYININGQTTYIELKLQECTKENIINYILRYIDIEKIIQIIDILKQNVEKINNCLIENIDKYIEGLEIEDKNNFLPILKQYKILKMGKTKQLRNQYK